MATQVIMPALGMAQETGTLLKWFKADGESVTKGEPLMEVETDKATVEIEASASGILTKVTAAPGDKVPVGETIAVILAPGESLPEWTGRNSTPSREPNASKKLPFPSKPSAELGATPKAGRVLATPAAKRIAREKGVDLAAIKGSGPEGSIVAEDVLKAPAAKTLPPGGAPKVRETIALTAMRRTIGERMSKSKLTAPHFYVSMDVEMTEISKRRDGWKEKGERVIPSINDFVLWSCAQALRDFPYLNASLTDRGAELFSDINIGFAVAIDDGLVAPVVRNADRLTLRGLAEQTRELAEKAQKKKLIPLDYEGGTFTVSNLGMLGVDSFIAIINPPQSAILAVGQVTRRAVPCGEQVVVRSMMTMTLSADHRIVDGVLASRFLQKVKASLEKPA